MIIKQEILMRLSEFKSLCEQHKVRYLYAFGSSTNDHFDIKTSDIDLLTEIDEPDPIERGEKLISLWDSLEVFFQRRVDLLTESSLNNPYLKESIDLTKVLVYDGKRDEVLV